MKCSLYSLVHLMNQDLNLVICGLVTHDLGPALLLFYRSCRTGNQKLESSFLFSFLFIFTKLKISYWKSLPTLDPDPLHGSEVKEPYCKRYIKYANILLGFQPRIHIPPLKLCSGYQSTRQLSRENSLIK